VDDPSAFARCGLVWVAVPETMLDESLARLQGVSLDGATIVICNSQRGSESFAIPATHVVTLQAVDQAEQVFAAEGHAAGLRTLRAVLAFEKRKLIELHPARKGLFLAGTQLSSELLLGPFGAGIESLRKAGFTRREATQTAVSLSSDALRAYAKGGRKGAGSKLRHAALHEIPDVRIADAYQAALEQAMRYFGR